LPLSGRRRFRQQTLFIFDIDDTLISSSFGECLLLSEFGIQAFQQVLGNSSLRFEDKRIYVERLQHFLNQKKLSNTTPPS